MTAYYNENDRYAAAWLRNLLAAGHIAPGDVDERSIADVDPVDLLGHTLVDLAEQPEAPCRLPLTLDAI